MEQYRDLLAYISYFEEDREQHGDWSRPEHSFPYIDYNDMINSFISKVSKSNIMKTDYLDYMSHNEQPEVLDKIESADLDLLKAILTYFIRQERFQEGLWEYAAKRGIFLRILKRLRQLTSGAKEQPPV